MLEFDPLKTELRFDECADGAVDVDDDDVVDDDDIVNAGNKNAYKCYDLYSIFLYIRMNLINSILYVLVFDKADDVDDCIEAIGVILTDNGSVELTSPHDFSSRGRFCFFFSGSPRPDELSTRFPLES